MKVCKKCKTHVVNSAKTCKNCGADVSKAKIIIKKKQNKKSSFSNAIINIASCLINIIKLLFEKAIESIISIYYSLKEEIICLSKGTVFITKKLKEALVSIYYSLKEEIICLSKGIVFIAKKLKEALVSIYYSLKEEIICLSKGIVFIAKKLKEALVSIYYSLKEEIIFLCKITVTLFKKIYLGSKYLVLNVIKYLKKLVFYIKNEIRICTISTFNSIYSFIKSVPLAFILLFKVIKSGLTKLRSIRKNAKANRIERRIKRKELEEELRNSIYNEHLIEINDDQIEIVDEPPHKRKGLKIVVTSSIVLILLSGSLLYLKTLYEDLIGKPIDVSASSRSIKATKDKVFSMDDIIEYNDVDYKIVSIETSNGNDYKSPKAGNQFLIVNIYIKNKGKEKVPYSYQNWTMSNSKNEEEQRIFTSINVDTALYSGELVRGGVKTGSIVFEQPINDPKLKMNFYELKKDEDGSEVIDQSKRIFSVSVKVPKPKNQTDKETTDLKIIKKEETVN